MQAASGREGSDVGFHPGAGRRCRVAVGLVPWHFTVRVPDPEDWEDEGWAGYPVSRRYASPYECSDQPFCSVPAETAALPAKPETWLGCVAEQRVGAGGEAGHGPVEDACLLSGRGGGIEPPLRPA